MNWPRFNRTVWGAIIGKPGWLSAFDGTWATLGSKPTLFSGAYADLTGRPTLFDGTWGSLTGRPSFAAVATSGAYADLSGVPNLAVYATITAMNAAIAAAVPARVFSNPTRALNTAVQISATRDCQVSYPVDISVSSLLLGSAQGTATLQYADNAGMSTNLVALMLGTNSTGGVLNVVNIGTVTLSGIVPAGKFARILTATNAGTANFTSRQGQEILL